MNALPAVAVDDAFGGGMVLLGAVVLLVSARYVWRATAVIRSTPVVRTSDAGLGALVRVSGDLEANDVYRAPFSHDPSLVLRYEVEEKRLSPLVLPWFVTLFSRVAAGRFRVDTGSDEVAVAEPARTVTLETETVATVGQGESPPDRVGSFERETADLPVSTVWRSPPPGLRTLFGALSLGTRRYREARAGPGDEVTVVGRLVETDGESAVDPLVVSDCPAGRTLVRMAGTSLAGVAVGLVALAVGAFLLAA